MGVKDAYWLVKEGVRAAVDKVFLSDELGVSLVKLKDVCVAAGVEAGKRALRAELGLSDEGGDGTVDHEAAMEDAMNAIVDADYVSHFGFADMGVDGLKGLAAALVVRD